MKKVLGELKGQQLYVNLTKCCFVQERLEYLGHVISTNGVEADQSKLKAMLNWPISKNIKEPRGFLGLTGYYRKFISEHGKIA